MHIYDHSDGGHYGGHHDDHHDGHHHSYHDGYHHGHHDDHGGQENVILSALKHSLEVRREGVIPYFIHHFPPFHHSVPESEDEGGQAEEYQVHYTHFRPNMPEAVIIGQPAHDLSLWQYQPHAEASALVAQEALLHHFGLHQTEGALHQEALHQGWYYQHGGTPMAQVGNLVAAHGLPIVRHEGGAIDELFHTLLQGHPALVTVNADRFWYGSDPSDSLHQYPGIPGQDAHHTVAVIGLRVDDLDHPLVILNDSSRLDGQGLEIPLALFEQAWAGSNHFIVRAATFPGDNTSPDTGPAQAPAPNTWADWQAHHATYQANWQDWQADDI